MKSKYLKSKILIFILILNIINSQVIAGIFKKGDSEYIRDHQFKNNEFIELKLITGKKIIIKFKSKSETQIIGNIVVFDQGNFRSKEEVKIDYEDIVSYKIIYTNEKLILSILLGLGIPFVILLWGLSQMDFSGLD